MQASNSSKTIVFIHGLFMNPASWADWVNYFKALGYTCYTPAYPYHAGNPTELRKQADEALGKLGFEEVQKSLVDFLRHMSEKPILIGHSMGGLMVQKLIEQGLGSMGVCIDSAAPAGIVSVKWSFLKANLPVINPFKGNSIFYPDPHWYHYAFCNAMTADEALIAFNTYVVPESRNIARESTGKSGKIDFTKAHVPLLFIAGEKDNIIPASLKKKNAEAYKDKNSKVDFKEFKGRCHYICGQQSWQEVADYAANWINQNN